MIIKEINFSGIVFWLLGTVICWLLIDISGKLAQILTILNTTGGVIK